MKKRILIVDDEPHILKLLSESFAGGETETAAALSGEEALDYARTHDLDLVITDIMMPGLNGIQLFYDLKKLDPFLQIIIITGYPSLQHIAEMMEAGATDFIIKPFEIAKLKAVAAEAFSRVERWHALHDEWARKKRAAQA